MLRRACRRTQSCSNDFRINDSGNMYKTQVQPPFRCFIDTDQHTYFPGDTVSCKVELTFDRNCVCEEVIALFTGEAQVRWTDKKTSTCHEQTRHLFEQSRPIWHAQAITKKNESSLKDILRFSSPNSIRSGDILTEDQRPNFRGFRAGTYKIPVRFKIPNEGVYSSLEVEQELIFIRYKIEILLDGRPRKNFHRFLHVIVPRDLNEDADTLGLATCSENTLNYKRGKLTAKLTLPKTGYTPGEALNAQVTVHNGTYDSVKFASVSIVKKYTVIANKPLHEVIQHEDETNGSMTPFHKIPRGERNEWEAQFYIPSLTPTQCVDGFVTVNYEAKLSVGFERGRRNAAILHVSIPITIGTVAIGNSQAVVQKKSENELRNRSIADPDPTDDPSAPPLSIEAPPPYEEVEGDQSNHPEMDERMRALTTFHPLSTSQNRV